MRDFDFDLVVDEDFEYWMNKKYKVSILDYSHTDSLRLHTTKDKLEVFYLFIEYLYDSKTHYGTFWNGHLSEICNNVDEARKKSQIPMNNVEYDPIMQLWEDRKCTTKGIVDEK